MRGRGLARNQSARGKSRKPDSGSASRGNSKTAQGFRGRGRSAKTFSAHDVFEGSDSEEEKKFLNRKMKSGGGDYNDFESLEPAVANIDSEDDEELDEDEAFDSEDERRYGHFFGKVGFALHLCIKFKPLKSVQDQDSEVGSQEEDDDEGMVDISDLINEEQSTSLNKPSKNEKFAKILMPNKDINDFDDSEIEADSEDMSDEDESESDEELDSLPLNRKRPNDDDLDSAALSTFIQGLDIPEPSKQTKFKSRTEAFEESEFNLPVRDKSSTELSSARNKLQLQDLVSVLKDSTEFGSLKKQLESFDKMDEKGGKNSGPLPAPLPSRLQDKVERKAAFDQTKKELNKWVPLVKKNREADHISFTESDQHSSIPSSGVLVSKFMPTTALEKEITSVLEESGLSEKKQRKMEELELAKISKEE
ncbi:hypothetical protein HK096_000098, partial [Nowakowskiella sp. JEL0078]